MADDLERQIREMRMVAVLLLSATAVVIVTVVLALGLLR